MDDSSNDVEVEGASAEEVFAILGNETRMGVLRALWESEEPCSFADLRRDVAPDNTGNFNYHLNKLTRHFVEKTEDGYVLQFGGEQVVRAVLTGTITSRPSIPPEETDERCVYCGEPVTMAHEKGAISTRCTGCGGVTREELPSGTYMHFGFPPAGLIGRSREEAIDAAHVLYDSKISPMMKGVCPECAGQTGISYDICSDHERDESGLCGNCDTRYAVWSQFECEYCSYRRQSVMWFAALNHPAVISFLHSHGLEEKIPFRKLTWDNATFVRDIAGTVAETDPYRFRVTVPIEQDALVVTLDEELDVLDVTHRSTD